jgi:hypothetical protein
MSILEQKYSIEPGQYGLKRIVVSGRCTHDERESIEGNCTHVFQLVRLPHASGAILKSMDGTTPRVVTVSPPALPGRSYECVKVAGVLSPFAIQQTGGTYSGKYIHRYRIVYQQVGGVA